jgi:hypothetical protein
VGSHSKEDTVTQLITLISLLLTLVCPLCWAQDASDLSTFSIASLDRPINTDTELASELKQSKKKIESLFNEYLVAFNASHEAGQSKLRIGLPLTSMAGDLIHFAYDVADKNIIMQWKFAQTKAYGTQWNFHAFMSQSRTASIAFSASF